MSTMFVYIHSFKMQSTLHSIAFKTQYFPLFSKGIPFTLKAYHCEIDFFFAFVELIFFFLKKPYELNRNLIFFFFDFRFRSSRGEHLDSIGIQTNVMDMNGSTRHRSPLPPPPTTVHLINGNGTVEQWSKLADQTNGQDQVKEKKSELNVKNC